jgi:hypothetical protein
MTLEPKMNRYMKYFDHIRMIQDYLCRQADERHICRINNTNIDRTLLLIQRVLFSVLQREPLGIQTTERKDLSNTLSVIHEEFTKIIEGICGSKEMSQWIQRRIEKCSQASDAIKYTMNTEAWMPSVDEDMLSMEEIHLT